MNATFLVFSKFIYRFFQILIKSPNSLQNWTIFGRFVILGENEKWRK